MVETDASWDECLRLGDFSRQRGIDSALLRLLAEGGHIPGLPKHRGSFRIPSDHPLTAEEAEAKGREAYDQSLEAAGREIQRVQSRMRRLLQ